MKKYIQILVIFFSVFIFGQKVSDYKYIAIPETFSGFKGNQYKLDVLLSNTLKEKKYVIVSGKRGQWSAEANSNPCSVLNADVLNDSGFLRNKIILEFKDCNDKIVASQKGSSVIKDYEAGFQDALNQALVIVPMSSPNISTRETTAEYLEKQVENEKIVVYKNNQKFFKKIKISSGRFTLINMENDSLYATFSNSFKKDVFRVEMQNGAKTIGFQENSNLFIEVPFDDGRYQLEEFVIQ